MNNPATPYNNTPEETNTSESLLFSSSTEKHFDIPNPARTRFRSTCPDFRQRPTKNDNRMKFSVRVEGHNLSLTSTIPCDFVTRMLARRGFLLLAVFSVVFLFADAFILW